MFANALSKIRPTISTTSMAKKHQRAMGMSLRTERATLEQVKARFKQNKRKNNEKDDDFEERMEHLKKMEEDRKSETKKAKKAKKQQEKELLKAEEIEDPEMSALGLPSGFGSTKKV